MFAMIAHGHFEKKYTGNTVTNELNNVVHFPNKISLYSDCTVVNNSKGGGVLIVIASQYPRDKSSTKEKSQNVLILRL